jgi:hypothetical protein
MKRYVLLIAVLFLGFFACAQSNEEEVDLIQEYDIYKTRWDFSLTPEVGVIELYETTSKNLQMLNLKVGIAMIIR